MLSFLCLNAMGQMREDSCCVKDTVDRNEVIMQQGDSLSYDDRVFAVVEQMPSFPGGQSAMMQYLATNMKCPKTVEENGIQGRVIVGFIVEKDGTITDVHTVRGVESALDKEAERIIKAMPKWTPGKQKGKPVRVSYFVPISFHCR